MCGHERLWELVRRLRCSHCGARDPTVEVGRAQATWAMVKAMRR
jgi:hypothetical protein